MFYLLARFLKRREGYLGASSYVPLPEWLKKTMRGWGYSTREMVHTYAKLAVGNDLSIIVKDEVGCAESVSRILMGVDRTLLPMVIPGTASLDSELRNNPRYRAVALGQVRPGDIVISPTVGGNGRLSNGHVGILGAVVGGERLIYSNTSEGGLWTQNYTLRGWINRYQGIGGFQVKFYTVVK